MERDTGVTSRIAAHMNTPAAMVAALIMMFLVVADVFMRRVLNMPIMGSNEIQRILLTMVIFFSVAYVMSIKGHVVVDTLTRLYSRKLQIIASVIALLLSNAAAAVEFELPEWLPKDQINRWWENSWNKQQLK